MSDAVPPWEGDGPIVRRWLATAVALQTRPDATYGAMDPDRPPGAALRFAALGFVASRVVGSAPWVLFALVGMLNGLANGSEGVRGMSVLLGYMFLYPVIAWLVAGTLLLGATHAMLVVTGETAGGFGRTARAMAYGFGSATPVLMLPYLGPLIFLLLGTVSATFGLGALQRVGLVRAVVALLLPAFLCGGAGVALLAYLVSQIRFH